MYKVIREQTKATQPEGFTGVDSDTQLRRNLVKLIVVPSVSSKVARSWQSAKSVGRFSKKREQLLKRESFAAIKNRDAELWKFRTPKPDAPERNLPRPNCHGNRSRQWYKYAKTLRRTNWDEIKAWRLDPATLVRDAAFEKAWRRSSHLGHPAHQASFQGPNRKRKSRCWTERRTTKVDPRINQVQKWDQTCVRGFKNIDQITWRKARETDCWTRGQAYTRGLAGTPGGHCVVRYWIQA